MLISRITAVAVTAVLAFTGFAPTASQAVQGQESDHTRVVLKKSVFETFQSGGVEVTPVGGADAYLFKGTAALHFNEVSQRNGVLKHTGGVVFKSDSGKLSLRRFTVDTNRGVVTAVANGSQRVRVFNVVDPSRRPQLGRLRLNLTGVAARGINATFGTSFQRGDTFAFATPYGRDRN